MTNTEYAAHLEESSKHYLHRAANGLDSLGWDTPIDWSEGFTTITDNYIAALVKAKAVTMAQVNGVKKVKLADAKRRAKIATLVAGSSEDPTTPRGFVNGRLAKLEAKVGFRGDVTIAARVYYPEDVKRIMRMSAIEADFPASMRGAIDDATTEWLEEHRGAWRVEVAGKLSERKDFDFDDLARTFFRATDTASYDLIAAILRKFVHQVRRKLADQEVEWHLMTVIHGLQGAGKTYLIRKMLAPLGDAVANTSFSQMTDERNISLWESPVIFLDEMAKASKSDNETVKNIISSNYIERRPMRANNTIMVRNRAVMIGASNHRLDELIKDDTGNRRFIELVFQKPEDQSVINRFDFAAMWQAVQPGDPDPLESFRDAVATLQAENAIKGPVEDWLIYNRHTFRGEKRTDELYDDFLVYRGRVTPGIDFQSRTRDSFSSELRRVVEANADWGITKVRRSVGFVWKFEPRADFMRMED